MRNSIMRSSSSPGKALPYASFTDPLPVSYSASSSVNASRVLGVKAMLA